MKERKFADVPKKSYFLIQLVLMLPMPFVFLYLAGHPLPASLTMGFKDIGASFLSLIIFIPILLLSMVILKFIFYGSMMGTKRKVTLKTKNISTILFIILAVPLAATLQAEAFLWITNRAGAESLQQALINGSYLFLAGTPGFLLSLKQLKEKMAQI